MLSIDKIGTKVRMRHTPTQELHYGIVIDGDYGYAIIQMNQSTKELISGPDRLLDTRYDNEWVFVEFGGGSE